MPNVHSMPFTRKALAIAFWPKLSRPYIISTKKKMKNLDNIYIFFVIDISLKKVQHVHDDEQGTRNKYKQIKQKQKQIA